MPAIELDALAVLLDQVVQEHHNGFDSFECEKPGCGRDWYHDDGYRHLTAETLRQIAARA